MATRWFTGILGIFWLPYISVPYTPTSPLPTHRVYQVFYRKKSNPPKATRVALGLLGGYRFISRGVWGIFVSLCVPVYHLRNFKTGKKKPPCFTRGVLLSFNYATSFTSPFISLSYFAKVFLIIAKSIKVNAPITPASSSVILSAIF